MKSKFILWLICFFTFVAEARNYELSETGPDVKIPIKLWEIQGSVIGRDTVTFAPLKVRLVEKTPGVLVDPEVIIALPRGGGEIDLSKFVRGSHGTFRVQFDLGELETEDKDKMSAYFISRAKKRKIDEDVWGAGCNKYMDVKSYLVKHGKEKGIEVNTTRSRHLTVLGGTFFFATRSQVAQVTFTDSTQSHLFCETPQVK